MEPNLEPSASFPGCEFQFTFAPPQHRLYFLPEPQGHGITVSGPAMSAAKNRCGCSTLIALPPLQLLR
jgi:hypothetical protein